MCTRLFIGALLPLSAIAQQMCKSEDVKASSMLQQTKHRASTKFSESAQQVSTDEKQRTDKMRLPSDTSTGLVNALVNTSSLRWFPVGVERNGSDINVVVVQFSTEDHQQLLKPDLSIIRDSPEQRRIPLSEFIQMAEDKPRIPTFLMFKVARCGSTLSDEMLKHDERFKIIAEPSVVVQVRDVLGSDANRKEDRIQLYRALFLFMVEPLHSTQLVTFFDFQSVSSWVLAEMASALPTSQRIFLWREPLEVADSLFNKPVGWTCRLAGMNHNSCKGEPDLVPAIATHMNRIVEQVDLPETKELGMKVFWYQHVLDGTLLSWIQEKAFPNALQDEALTSKMLSALDYNSKTGDPIPAGFVDHDQIAIGAELSQTGVIKYNANLTRFKTLHPVFSLPDSQRVPELSWPEDRHLINEHLTGSRWNMPVVIRNATRGTLYETWTEEEVLEQIRTEQNENYAVLAATQKENYFVWHRNEERMKQEGYYVFSEWTSVDNLSAFERDPSLSVVASAGEYIKRKLLAGEGGTYSNTSIFQLMKGLGRREKEGTPDLQSKFSLRISHEGAVTAPHWDDSHSTLLQLGGEKRVVFWPPDELHNLGPYGRDHVMSRRVLADPEQLDAKNLPNFSLDRAMHSVVRPGDMVYFPVQWVHWMRTERGPSISIGRRMKSTGHHTKLAASQDLIDRVEASRYAKGRPVWELPSTLRESVCFQQGLEDCTAEGYAARKSASLQQISGTPPSDDDEPDSDDDEP